MVVWTAAVVQAAVVVWWWCHRGGAVSGGGCWLAAVCWLLCWLPAYKKWGGGAHTIGHCVLPVVVFGWGLVIK